MRHYLPRHPPPPGRGVTRGVHPQPLPSATDGLIVGGIAGGVLGHVIAPGGSKTLGTIIGAGAGALLGRAVDDGDIVCR